MKIQWPDGPTEHRKCLCKHKACSWAQKSEICPITITGTDNSISISDGHHSGDSSDLTMGLKELRNIVREISLTNNGNIYVNLNL